MPCCAFDRKGLEDLIGNVNHGICLSGEGGAGGPEQSGAILSATKSSKCSFE